MADYVVKQYAEVDALILDVLNGQNLTFTSISGNRRIKEAAASSAKVDAWGSRSGWRVVDRRLQALRKEGKIQYSRRSGWSRV